MYVNLISDQHQWQQRIGLSTVTFTGHINNCLLFLGFKMYRQVVQLGCDSSTSSGDWGGSHGECSAQGDWRRGASGPRPCVQVEADGRCRGERPGNGPEQWQWANYTLNFFVFSVIVLCVMQELFSWYCLIVCVLLVYKYVLRLKA